MLSWVFSFWRKKLWLGFQAPVINIKKQREIDVKESERTRMINNSSIGSSSSERTMSVEQENGEIRNHQHHKDEGLDDEASRVAMLAALQAKEEEIEKRKMAVKGRVELELGRVEEETKKLVHIWEEIQVMEDPMKKEVAMLRKKVDLANREVKGLAQSSQKKEKEYKEVLEAFNEKSKEKSALVATLKDLLARSESLRMKKLEELSKFVESTD
ncbi:unnamed protein product [Linum trigynum]|uniref:RAB6-interacting golgin n=2 Tax=Linum trigynum TaxID=586398 RepID=A0AAV2DJD0_9ROSI